MVERIGETVVDGAKNYNFPMNITRNTNISPYMHTCIQRHIRVYILITISTQ